MNTGILRGTAAAVLIGIGAIGLAGCATTGSPTPSGSASSDPGATSAPEATEIELSPEAILAADCQFWLEPATQTQVADIAATIDAPFDAGDRAALEIAFPEADSFFEAVAGILADPGIAAQAQTLRAWPATGVEWLAGGADDQAVIDARTAGKAAIEAITVACA